MGSIILSKQSERSEIRRYFEGVLKVSKSKEEFPVNLDDVWPLVYARKSDAVEALKQNFMQSIDYQVFRQNPQNLKGGRPVEKYCITVSCLEYFIVRKVRPVFEVYRQVFHKVANNEIKAQEPMTDAVIMAKALLIAQQTIELNEKKIEFQQHEINARKELLKEQHQAILDKEAENIVLSRQNKKLVERIRENEDKALYYDQCAEMADDALLSFRETAAMLNIPERQFVSTLCDANIVYKSKGKLMPYAKYLDKGFFRLVEWVNHSNGYYYQTKITPAGRMYLNNNWEKFSNTSSIKN